MDRGPNGICVTGQSLPLPHPLAHTPTRIVPTALPRLPLVCTSLPRTPWGPQPKTEDYTENTGPRSSGSETAEKIILARRCIQRELYTNSLATSQQPNEWTLEFFAQSLVLSKGNKLKRREERDIRRKGAKLLLFTHSVILDSATPRTAARQASLSFTISRSLLKLMSIESVMPSNYPVLCHPLLLLPPVFPSIRVFSNESGLCIRWPSIGVSASASVFPRNTQDWFPLELTGLISLQPEDSQVQIMNSLLQGCKGEEAKKKNVSWINKVYFAVLHF